MGRIWQVATGRRGQQPRGSYSAATALTIGGAGRAAPLVRNKGGTASRDARESSQNWIASWSEVGSYNPEDSAYDKQHREDIERELERISALEEQRAQRQLSSSAWMKDAEDVVVYELDAAEFEEIHGIDVQDIHAEERDAYTDLNAMWSADELDTIPCMLAVPCLLIIS